MMLPSGKLWQTMVNYGKLTRDYGKIHELSMAISNSYMSLPQGSGICMIQNGRYGGYCPFYHIWKVS